MQHLTPPTTGMRTVIFKHTYMLFGFSLGVAVYQSSLAQDDVQTTPDLSQRHSSPEL